MNNFRRQHSAADLVNDPKIEKVAQEWADYLAKENKFEHRKNPKYGENLAKSGSAEESSAAQRWYDEIEYYKFPNKDNLFFHGSGHFTQLIWKGSQRVGVGVARANGCTIVVANYDPPGNILGHFYENVLPKK